MLVRLALVALACWAAGARAADCGECDPSQCAVATDCYAGVVMDLCNCCAVCGKREGEECDDPQMNIRKRLRGDGRCGENLECQVVKTNQKKGRKVRIAMSMWLDIYLKEPSLHSRTLSLRTLHPIFLRQHGRI